MRSSGATLKLFLLVPIVFGWALTAGAQRRQTDGDEEFGPVVRAYLGYLRNEQEVVDDRVSRREISRSYYVRNTNRIRALREIAIRLARETRNDYLPELEAVARDEMGTLFDRPPKPERLRPGQVLNEKFKFLGSVRSGETFYVFVRLDPYEQAELKPRSHATNQTNSPAGVAGSKRVELITRPRRVVNP
jgi:hypothetical protein